MGTRYGPIEYREKDHYDIDQKLLSVDHCESMSYFGDFNHIMIINIDVIAIQSPTEFRIKGNLTINTELHPITAHN